MNRASVLLLMLLSSVFLVGLDGSPRAAQQPGPQTNEIRRLYDEDQKDRDNFMTMTPEQIQAMSQRDAQRRKRAREILAQGLLQTGEDFRFAAFIFQHGDAPEDFLLAHLLAVTGISKGDAKSRWIAAATLDRFLHRIQQPQVFGTQYSKKNTDTEWTQQPFNRELLPESLRWELCVPSLAQQARMLEAMNKNQELQPPKVCP